MLNSRRFKKLITIVLMVNLIYANFSMAISGMISYAVDEEKMLQDISKQDEANEEQKALEIQLSEFCKDNMANQETKYQEKIKLNLDFDQSFDELEVNDVNTVIGNSEPSEDETQESKEVKTFYKTTKIVKDELIKAISENGSLEIKYSVEEDENKEKTKTAQEDKNLEQENLSETDENLITLPEEENIDESNIGKVFAKDGKVVINAETIADEEGYITVVYPEKTYKVDFKILKNPNKTSELLIINDKVIEKVENVKEINLMQVTKQIIIKGETELLNTIEMTEMPIEYSKTFAELGIDKTQISTSIENKVNFTITLHTNRAIYDLFKNPQFMIALPKEVNNISIDNITMLNNNSFVISSLEKGMLEDGTPVIVVKLEGEQLERTKSIEENTQIILETTLITEKMIPTIQSQVSLYYENIKTYEGIDNISNGIDTKQLDIISNKEMMVETETIVGNNTIKSNKRETGKTIIEPNTYNSVTVNERIINNLGENIKQAMILGTSTKVGKISGIDYTVYYTENPNPTTDIIDLENGWSTEYTENAKSFLVIVNDFAQGQEVCFTFGMELPTNIEEDIEHNIIIDVYNNQNMVATTTTTIKQEAEHLEVYEDENIKAQVYVENKKELEVGDYTKYTFAITNKTNKDLNNITLRFNLPDGMEKTLLQTAINTEVTDGFVNESDNSIIIKNINIPKKETFTATVNGQIKQFVNSSETIKADFVYENNTINISTKLKFVIPSTIKTSIITNKPGQTLEAGDEIEYLVTLINDGKSHATVNFSLQDITCLDIQEIHAVNINTTKECRITSGSLEGSLSGILIDPNETVKIHITGVAKDLKKQGTQVTYAKITGVNIYEVDTEKIINTINAKTEVVIETPATENESTVKTMNTNNMIKGVAWIDKNANGRRDNTEALLKGVQASLVNTETGERVETQITNNKGEYEFTNIPDGKYSVEFNYNTKVLSVTEYKREEVENDLDSDAINTTQNNETVAKTKVIKLKDGQTENANAGFVINKNFDMSVNKGITKITVNDNVKTEKYDFNAVNTAKVEIDGKNIKGSLVLVEYEIAITNNGEVAGYAKAISDKIPEGMKFSSELNKDWYEKDGKIYSIALANKCLQPGETAIVKLILTKEMNDDKVIALVNNATLEETFNDYLIPDQKEDNNKTEATLIISLTTGIQQNYIWLIVIVIAIIGCGMFGTRKILKHNNYNKERRK